MKIAMYESNNLKLISYNMHGFNQGHPTVTELINEINPDIFLLQEHWLTPANLDSFDKLFDHYFTFGSSAMSDAITTGMLKGRPFGGIMFLIKNSLRKITETIYSCDRFAIIKISSFIVVNVYFPCHGTKNRSVILNELLTDLQGWLDRFSMYNIIVAGDINADLSNTDNATNCINSFFNNNSLMRCDLLGSSVHQPKPTYVNIPLEHESVLDYILVSDPRSIIDYDVLDPSINYSDHRPIIGVIKFQLSNANNDIFESPTDVTVSKLRWDKADKNAYYENSRCNLEPILSDINDFTDAFNIMPIDPHLFIDDCYDNIINVLNTAANLHVPRFKQDFFKFWWDTELDLLKEESIKCDKVWKAVGKPKFGSIFDNRQKARSNYRKSLREKEKLKLNSYTNDLHEALMKKDGPTFWKSWKSKFESRTRCQQVDGCVDDNIIAGNFAHYFNQLYSCGNNDQAVKLRDEYIKRRAAYIGLPLTDSYLFNTELVSTKVSQLKLGKAAGVDCITAEHLLYCHPIISCILSKLFNLMLTCGYVPAKFGVSYTIPIPKVKDVRSKTLSVDDFRGIAISSVISKVFEFCIFERFNLFLSTSNNQFGFKKGSGCTHAIYRLRQTVERFINGGCTINICSIDLSKAFDRVNHNALFMKLMNRNIPLALLSVLEMWYNNYCTCIKWNSSLSHFFRIHSGVRQGSVLAPILFAIYINDIVDGLPFGKSYAVIMYADDILLLTPSVVELQNLLSKCESELTWLEMKINVSKSCCMRIGPRHNIKCADIVTSQGCAIPWTDELKYLGVFITRSSTFKCSINHSKRAFYAAANAIFGKIGRIASEETILHLLQNKCIPLLTYGLEAFKLNKSTLCSLDFTVNRFFMKLFKTSNLDIIGECQSMFGFHSLSTTLVNRCKKFEELMNI
jgi:endonuclease/exonuclease/phosphatase family metal-dependent hydrolase